MAKIVGDTSEHRRAARAARCRPTSRRRSTKVFADPPKAAMVFEGDFVAGVISTRPRRSRSTATTRSRSRRSTARRRSVVGGGDFVVMFKRQPGDARRSSSTSRRPRRPRSGPKQGGFIRRTRTWTPASTRTRSRRRRRAPLARPKSFRFDMSDLQPAAFGGTAGQGEWRIFQDFLKNPNDIDGITAAAGGRRREGVQEVAR